MDQDERGLLGSARRHQPIVARHAYPSTIPAVPENRRDRRRRQTRIALVDAARALITSGGVEALTIGDITDAADVARGSFYNYFQTKQDIVEAVATESLQEVAARVLSEIPGDDPAERAALADRRFLRLAYDDPEFARLILNLTHADTVFVSAVVPAARAEIEPGIAAGRFTVVDADVMLITLATSALGVIREIVEGRAPRNADRSHAELVLRMLGVDDAEAREIARRPLPRRRKQAQA